ncbi:hypothetical protein [Clostridium pasteurianum]|uniref:Alpha/beta hydrolase n=1 Tax=Clostridium pasteurianum BC1 TaxID=86416 RepID=R4K3S4_CLOPA|nr:hypothetical protein [Clostridium pasteurianum]AGK97233.1 hypothetical protein Clopa_2370 [Clostridium pasteurianum BC1]
MYEFLPIVYNSSEGNEVINDYYYDKNDSNSLVVLFPGVNYSCEKPLLHYARKAAVIEGYDVLCVRYGYKLSKDDIGKEIIKTIAEEVLQTIKNCDNKKYNKLYFISKSIGGEVAGNIANKIGYDNVKSLYLTPTPNTSQHMIKTNAYAVVGTKDKIFTEENIVFVKAYKNVNLTLIDNAQHSLEIDGNIEKSIESLSKVAGIFKEFLEKSKINN